MGQSRGDTPKVREEMVDEWNLLYEVVGEKLCYVWWPKMDEDLEQKVRQCSNRQNSRELPPVTPLLPWEWPLVTPLHPRNGLPRKPWVPLHLYYSGPLLGKMSLL